MRLDFPCRLSRQSGALGPELLHLLLQLTHAADYLWQVLHRNHLPLGLFVRSVAHHARLRTDSGLVAELQMSRNPRLRGHDAIVSQVRAAGEADLSHDDAVPPNHNVVRDVHEVVDLGALADDGGAERAAVDRSVGPDLHIVVNNYIAHLQHLAVKAFIQHITESVRADHGTRVDSNSPADL